MNPWSCAGIASRQPASVAFFKSASTSFRLSQDGAMSPKGCREVSQNWRELNVLKKG